MEIQAPIKTQLIFDWFEWPNSYMSWAKPAGKNKCVTHLRVGPGGDGNWFRPSEEAIDYELNKHGFVQAHEVPPPAMISLIQSSLIMDNDREFQLKVEKLRQQAEEISIKRQELKYGVARGSAVILDIDGRGVPAIVQYDGNPTGEFWHGIKVRPIWKAKVVAETVRVVTHTMFESMRYMTNEEKKMFLPDDHPDIRTDFNRYKYE